MVIWTVESLGFQDMCVKLSTGGASASSQRSEARAPPRNCCYFNLVLIILLSVGAVVECVYTVYCVLVSVGSGMCVWCAGLGAAWSWSGWVGWGRSGWLREWRLGQEG